MQRYTLHNTYRYIFVIFHKEDRHDKKMQILFNIFPFASNILAFLMAPIYQQQKGKITFVKIQRFRFLYQCTQYYITDEVHSVLYQWKLKPCHHIALHLTVISTAHDLLAVPTVLKKRIGFQKTFGLINVPNPLNHLNETTKTFQSIEFELPGE